MCHHPSSVFIGYMHLLEIELRAPARQKAAATSKDPVDVTSFRSSYARQGGRWYYGVLLLAACSLIGVVVVLLV